MAIRRGDRIAEAGMDVARIARSEVLLKIGELDARALPRHPVWPLCRALQAVGFAAVHLHGGIDYFETIDPSCGSSFLEAGPQTSYGSVVVQAPDAWIGEGVLNDVPRTDIVVDLTNDPQSKLLCASLCAKRRIPFVSVAWDATWAAVRVTTRRHRKNERLHAVLGSTEFPLPPVSRIAAGLALQEVLLLAGGPATTQPPEGEVVYDVASDQRIQRATSPAQTSATLHDVTAEVIGAGGIGVHLLECLGPLMGRGCTLRVFDPDVVAHENLSLQTAYGLHDVGRPKAQVIAEKLVPAVGPGVEIRPFCVPYQVRPAHLGSPTVRIACPDNFAARKYANELSIGDGVPLVEAGSSPLAAQQRSYVPGKTACLAHRMPNLDEEAAREAVPASCGRVRELTLPGTNMIIGSILAAEVRRVVCPEAYGEPCQGVIMYDARVPARFGIVERRPPCEHDGVKRRPGGPVD